jgi:group I intron endonuclease
MNNFFNCGVYRWFNTVTNQSYIGSSKHLHRRKNEHLRELRKRFSPSLKLQHAWNKYGETAFEFETLAFCPEVDLLKQEQLALNAFDAVNTGYNISPEAGAPMRGRKASIETRLKLSAAHRGKPKSAEHAKKIGEAHLGMKRSEAVRAKFSSMRRGKPVTSVQLEALAAGRAKLALPEVRAKIGAASRKLWQRPERRAKSAARTKANYEQALATYLESPKLCEICGAVIMPTQSRSGTFADMNNRKHCSRACANRARTGEKHGPMPLQQRQAISLAKRAKAGA